MHAQGDNVIGCVIVSTKIAIAQDVGILATHKHNESIEFDENQLASVCFKSRDAVHKRHK